MSTQVNSKLASFLYELMRDHVPAGKVEKIVQNSFKGDIVTNEPLATYAEEVATRLTEEPKRLFEDILSGQAQADLDKTVLGDLQAVAEILRKEAPELFDKDSPIQLKELRYEGVYESGKTLTREQAEGFRQGALLYTLQGTKVVG